jgi:hypothetical protein
MTQLHDQALWASQILVDCLREAGNDVDAGFAAAEYILSIEADSYDYPRNKSNQFLSKLAIAAAARDDAEYKKLRDSLPEDQCWKLDNKVCLLQGGGTVHHPSEVPGLGVDINGVVVDPKWATHDFEKKCREEWEAREAARNERRKLANKAVRSFRSEYKPLDRVKSLLKKAGATPSELRSLDRIRHEFDTDKINQVEFERLYEEVIESVHLRIDEECLRDPEAGFPGSIQPYAAPPAAFAVDRRGVSHRASGPTGGQFVPTGQEGPESAGESQPQRATGADAGATSNAGGGSQVQGGSNSTGGGVEGAAPGPDLQQVGTAGQGQGVPSNNTVTGDVPGSASGSTTDPAKLTSVEKFNRRIGRYANYFRSINDNETSEWLEEIQEHVNLVGIEAADEALGEEKRVDIGHIAYKGSGYHKEDDNTDYIRKYLARAGLYFQPGSDPVSGTSTVASHPIPKEDRHKYTSTSVIPGSTTFENKLEEAKHLPGLESTEDLDVIVGSPTKHVTNDILTKLDERYGKDSWIIKSYGDEAYAGFGIYFPQYIQTLKQGSRAMIHEVNSAAAGYGLRLARDKSGKFVGFTNGSQITPFGATAYPVSKTIEGRPPHVATNHLNRIARVAQRAQANEFGPHLPRSSEEYMMQRFGISLHRDQSGKPAGVMNEIGVIKYFGTPEYEEYTKKLGKSKNDWIERSIEGLDDPPPEGSVRYMAQPAFEAIGESDAHRALGLTWSKSEEGRVHVAVRNGVAKAFATMVDKSDGFPVVYHDDQTRAMEKAAEDAINGYPESERQNGAVYSPDVMRTKDGWKVVEGNASVEGGSSSWLENNPVVMDAYISHLVGRDPAHVQFIRNLLRDKMTNTRKMVNHPSGGVKLSTEDQPRHPAGTSEGGQWTKYKEKEEEITTVKHGKLEVNYVLWKSEEIKGSTKLDLPNYWQEDYHSCGFVAALTVARHLKLDASAKDVLKAVRPSINYGVDRFRLIAALEKLGVKAKYRKNLTVEKLRELVEEGTPVIVSVWPDGWYSDHWTIVQGFDDDGIHLTNYGHSTLEEFATEWSDMDMRSQGNSKEGIVCTRATEPKTKPKVALSIEAALAVDRRGVSHKSSGPQGGQFVPKGDEGPDKPQASNKGGAYDDLPPTDKTEANNPNPEGPSYEKAIEAALLEEEAAAAIEESDRQQELISSTPKGREQVRAKMTTLPIVNTRDLRGGINKIRLVSFEDGSLGVWKPSSGENRGPNATGMVHPALEERGIHNGTQYRREIAAHALAEMLGMGDLVPETVLREHEFEDTAGPGSVQRFVSGARTADDMVMEYIDKGIETEPKELLSPEDRVRATIFDYITMNTDRHEGNWMITRDNKPRLIDNGLAFPNRVSKHDLPSYAFVDPEVLKAEIPESIRATAARHEEIARSLDSHGIESKGRDAAIKRLKRLGNREHKTVGQYIHDQTMYEDYSVVREDVRKKIQDYIDEYEGEASDEELHEVIRDAYIDEDNPPDPAEVLKAIKYPEPEKAQSNNNWELKLE